jgi:hypothetical protein
MGSISDTEKDMVEDMDDTDNTDIHKTADTAGKIALV